MFNTYGVVVYRVGLTPQVSPAVIIVEPLCGFTDKYYQHYKRIIATRKDRKYKTK